MADFQKNTTGQITSTLYYEKKGRWKKLEFKREEWGGSIRPGVGPIGWSISAKSENISLQVALLGFHHFEWMMESYVSALPESVGSDEWMHVWQAKKRQYEALERLSAKLLEARDQVIEAMVRHRGLNPQSDHEDFKT